MRCVGCAVSLVLLVSASVAFAADAAYVHVKTGPGVKVFVGGEFKGVTNKDEAGLVVEAPPGQCGLKFVKAGFRPQETTVTLRRGQVLPLTLRPFVPRLKISETGEDADGTIKRATGTLVIQTIPVAASVDIPHAGVNSAAKTKDRWKAEDLPQGTYQVKVSAMGRTKQFTVDIKKDGTTRALVNLFKGTVKVDVQGGEPGHGGAAPASFAAARRRQQDAAKKLGVPLEKTIDLGGQVPMPLVFVPAGEFMMGSNNGEENERAVHKVVITRPFYLGKYEVMQEQWEKITGKNPSVPKGAKHPVNNVSWNDCQDFLKKLNAQVKVKGAFTPPTEAEWEYACRAGSTTEYCFGNDHDTLREYAWYYTNPRGKAHAVGQKKPNAWGLHDMHGNVWEWCQDWYKSSYSTLKQTDPTGPAQGTGRVLRGGSWSNDAWYCRSASRDDIRPATRYGSGGFRVVLRGGVD